MSASNSESEQRSLLSDDLRKTPDTSPSTATAATSPPATTPRHRPGYARIPSVSFIDENMEKGITDTAGEDDITQAPRSSTPGHGLGIAIGTSVVSKARRVSIQSIPRAPTVRGTPDQQTPGSADPLISPPSTGGFSGSTRFDGSPHDFDTAYSGAKYLGKQSMSSLHSSFQPSLYAKSDAGLISVRSRYDDWEPQESCRSHQRVKKRMGTCFSVTIVVLAVFSTLLSALLLGTALHQPRYGRKVGTHGSLTPSSAAFLTSFLAKLVELSFVTVLVAFLGQALARRAYQQEQPRGVTLAELSMRTWVMQPGTMLTQWEGVRYAGISVLGIISLLGAICAMLYTSAATALVQPQLKWPEWSPKTMQGLVKTQFANPAYIEQNCQTPISVGYDPNDAGTTCIQIEHAAAGYHNYFAYLGTWAAINDNATGSTDLAQRPKGFATLTDTTTIAAPWIERTNVTELYLKDFPGKIINNVSMAMPHPGVIQAAIDAKNNIMQPADLEGLGSYNIRASVPSPVVHVLCVTMNKTTLKPFVRDLWDDAKNASLRRQQLDHTDPYLGGTDFDDVFQWGTAYGSAKWPPIFDSLPLDFNTIINDTAPPVQYGRDSIYLLGKGGLVDSGKNPTNGQNYALCQLKMSITPNCSTSYNASASGATLEATCEDGNDKLRFIESVPKATSGNDTINNDWVNIASEWGQSLALNDGTLKGNGSNSRLLTQFILTAPAWGPPALNPVLPSMAEALAVMAGCTLLQAATDAPFVMFWNYTLSQIELGHYQSFNASLRAQQYASGGNQPYQKVFYLVLLAVFLMNLMVLVYFLVHWEWYTDFSEPTTLFSLAVNSPPSKELAGTCGGGPAGEHFKVSWKLNRDGEHVYMESQEYDETMNSPGMRRRRLGEGIEMMMSPVKRAASTFSGRRSR